MGMLAGRTAVITGSTSGIGLGIAQVFAREGANIVLNGLGSATDNAEVIASIKDLGVEVQFAPANMMKPAQITRMIEKAEQKFGGVDILVNNAGIQHVAPVEEFPVEKWDAIIAINLTAAFHGIRAVVPGMRKRGWGRIISTASAHSLVASPYKAAYVTAKHGIAGLTKSIALEVATDGITVNAISPGYVWTPLVANQVADTAKARKMSEKKVKEEVLLAAQPTKEFVTVGQVAAMALYLCSDAAAQITGANMVIDGGWTAQ